jgi:hypothetical protein
LLYLLEMYNELKTDHEIRYIKEWFFEMEE